MRPVAGDPTVRRQLRAVDAGTGAGDDGAISNACPNLLVVVGGGDSLKPLIALKGNTAAVGVPDR
jgi:hypothetical protein